MLERVKKDHLRCGTHSEISLRTARSLFTDLFPVTVNTVDHVIKELVDSGQIIEDKGWLKAK